ncbi:UNKNOWN [Stylonychia lemnae]|uniref:Uncharacterized protein n=1 Tax=Stylonychia lemnae TaxID=5949 RepID=A0A078B7J2_STYLE|nr:UNKNOWN [Stylonychia lemnae]|eukprot:CDW89513.1 UNKNOWN [Stylonychia lemnae]
MAIYQIILGITVGVALLAYFSNKPQNKEEKGKEQKNQDNNKQPKKNESGLDEQKQRKLDKYVNALESSSVKDFQAMIKKIDDQEERKEVLELLKSQYSKGKGTRHNTENMSMEEQFADAADSFGKNICVLFLELSFLAILVLGAGYLFGFINFEDDVTK